MYYTFMNEHLFDDSKIETYYRVVVTYGELS